jgi:hypothetical protein
MDKARILEKVRKCLALANNEGGTEAERARALAQAGKLLASVNLTMSAVTGENEDRVRHFHDFTPEMAEWPRAALGGISRLFFCKYYRQSAKDGVKYFYVGRAVNVATCQLMVEYVMVNIVKEAKKRAAQSKLASVIGTSMPGTGFGKDWEYGFCLGASEAVRVKCEELIKQREAEGIEGEEGSGTALMVVSMSKQETHANMAFLETLGVNLVVSGIKQAQNGAAYAAGAKHGSSINLSRQVAHSGGPKLIGGK